MCQQKEEMVVEKFKVARVEITRQEGKSELCGIKKVFSSINEANYWLLSQSYTFPKDGGYDKHKFVVFFDWEGEIYEGRLDCKHHECDNNDLDIRKHILQTKRVYANLERPTNMSDSVYADFVERNMKYGLVAEAEEFLKQHEI